MVLVLLGVFLFIQSASTHGEKSGDFLYGDHGESDIGSLQVKDCTLTIFMKNGTTINVTLSPLKDVISPKVLVHKYTNEKREMLYNKTHQGDVHKEEICDYEGSLPGDPQSRLTMSGCEEILLTIVTEKMQFNRNSYRFVHKLGGSRRRRHRRRRFKRSPHGEMFVKGHELVDDTGDIPYKEAHKVLDGSNKTLSSHVSEFQELTNRTKHVWDSLNTNKSSEFAKWFNMLEDEATLENPTEFNVPKVVIEKPKTVTDQKTLKIMVIVDPYLYQSIQKMFEIKDEDEVVEIIYGYVHEILVSAQAFLLHPSISSTSGYRIKLTGLRVLKEWGPLLKMSKRAKLLHILHDLANYLKIVSRAWALAGSDYTGVVFFTGKENFTDGDGYAYIGNVCLADCPVVSKVKFNKEYLDPNMGRLLAHELGHLLGASHDDEAQMAAPSKDCQPGKFLMTKAVNKTMQSWSICSREAIDEVFTTRTAEYNCFFT